MVSNQLVRDCLFYEFKVGLFAAASSTQRRALVPEVHVGRPCNFVMNHPGDDEALKAVIGEDNSQICHELVDRFQLSDFT